MRILRILSKTAKTKTKTEQAKKGAAGEIAALPFYYVMITLF
jgi:hypothetical protein